MALDVESQGRRDMIFDSCDPEEMFENEVFSFRGIYGVAAETSAGVDLYLGRGSRLGMGDHSIGSHFDKRISASLKRTDNGEYLLVSDAPARVTIPVPKGQGIRILDVGNVDSNQAYNVPGRWGRYTELWEPAEILSRTSLEGCDRVEIRVREGKSRIRIVAHQGDLEQ